MNALRPSGLLANIEHRSVTLAPRRRLREPGWSEATFIVQSGVLALYRVDQGGKRQIVSLRFPGEMILATCGDYGVEAVVHSEVAIVASDLSHRPDLATSLLPLVQRDAAIAYEWLVNHAKDCTARVAHLLCETAIRGGYGTARMVNPFTQQQIADITGQTSVNVNRVFADIERQGLIRRGEGREIEFLDWDELRRLASFQPDYLEAA